MEGIESVAKKTMTLSDIKQQASSYIQEKCKGARLALTDLTQAELLTEEATGSDPRGPDAKTMTRISEAAYDTDDYWRIVDIIHRRLRCVNYQEWRQSYKTLVLLEFLLTHGPEHMFEEFHCDARVIGELGKMNYVDERGFNWGACMKQKAQKLLRLLADEALLAKERSKALKISREIQGFGNLIVSPSASTPSSSSSKSSRTSSFSAYSCDSPAWTKQELYSKSSEDMKHDSPTAIDKKLKGIHLWDNPIQEDGMLLENAKNENVKLNSPGSWSKGFYARIFGNGIQTMQDKASGLRSLSDAGKEEKKKKIDRQFSLRF